jgi:hypothetical protein
MSRNRDDWLTRIKAVERDYSAARGSRVPGTVPRPSRRGRGAIEPRSSGAPPRVVARPGPGLATYQLLRQGGYTELVVYLAQQIQQFRLRGEEFAMQHLGTEDELKRIAREIAATMSPEERRELLSDEEWKQAMPERLGLLSDEELVQALSPERLEHVRRLLEQRRPADGNASGPKTS